jgi:hypothetical protein
MSQSLAWPLLLVSGALVDACGSVSETGFDLQAQGWLAPFATRMLSQQGA